MQTWMWRWCHPLVEQSAKTAALKCWVKSKVVAGSSEIGLWFISEEHPKKCLLFRRQSRDEGWSVGRMNSGINFFLEKPSAVCLGRKNEAPSPSLPAHLSLNLEQLALAGWATLASPCRFLGLFAAKSSICLSSLHLSSCELCQESWAAGTGIFPVMVCWNHDLLPWVL